MELGVREWFLILGGLMIAAVLAHGVFIFLRSRKNQIGLQYERNIPDADIDDLELLRGELPSGGARVVSRPAAGDGASDAPASAASARTRHTGARAVTGAASASGSGTSRRATARPVADSAPPVPVLMDPIDRDLADAAVDGQDAPADSGTDAGGAPGHSAPPAPSRSRRSSSAQLAADLDELGGILGAPRTPAPGLSEESFDSASGADDAAPGSGEQPGATGDASNTAPASKAARRTASIPDTGVVDAGDTEHGEETAPAAEKPRAAARASRAMDPDHDMEQTPLFAGQPIVARDRSGRDSGRGRKAAGGRAASSRPAAGRTQTAEPRPQEPPEDVIVVQVLCRRGGRMPGPALLEIITDRGLRFGDMNIFHRYAGSDRGRIEFSLASAVEPGTFDLGAMEEFETPGVTLFLQLPGPEQPLDAFEDMVGLAKALADELDAELKDEQHSVMTAQTIEHCRNRIREFTRRQMSRRA